MFQDFFYQLREGGVPVTLKEYLAFLGALDQRVIEPDVEQFYFLARTALVKDERFFDAFDKTFGAFFKGIEKFFSLKVEEIPREWLDGPLRRLFSAEELAKIKAQGSWKALMEAFVKMREEQQARHQGGNRRIGTGGKAPFGQAGMNPRGLRAGEEGKRLEQGIKVWEKREYQNLSAETHINTRNIKLVLKRLRRFTREGADEELDIDGTIRETARNGAMFDVEMRPSRKNRVKVLLFFDIGGSMAPHIKRCEQLFTSSRTEFKHLETYYFHNCIYEFVWRDSEKGGGKLKTYDILHKFNRDYRVIIVGDASMSPYEIMQVGGSVDHFNDEPGINWLTRLRDSFPHMVWLNPEPPEQWEFVESIGMIRTFFGHRMYPLTLDGLHQAMTLLRRTSHVPIPVAR
ncbi:MAG: VWA domain-containing protein [Candidatus Lambdaproteobacteria bacterium]|nr:VWA domain-containing protein [Candidatus Lambdaproteobacteria bacterium]